ncbi:hypothetical protein [Flexithrix dorotheae]|uniref:hypothetical protein n=1 Tax=Flexithrix dorotheae TaxID=70993 RepID=UPI0012F8E5FA|nr:hypothetical protein [Flexithrix dorotheae]
MRQRIILASLFIILLSTGMSSFNPEFSNEISLGEAELKACQINNFSEFFPARQHRIIKEIYFWENESLDFRKVPKEDRLPHGLLRLTEKDHEVNVINPSPFGHTFKSICWIPSIDLFYELMIVAHQMKETYGTKLCPPQSMILALLAHETYMRDITGDGGLSIGMCQLYRPSAQFITSFSANKSLFNKLIYFDEKGNHHFYNQRAMIEFIYHFLILEKGYSNATKSEAITAYNGGGKMAKKYGKLVLMKTLYYEALIRAFKADSQEVAVKDLRAWSGESLKYTYLNTGFGNPETEYPVDQIQLTEEERKELEVFKFTVCQYVLELKTKSRPASPGLIMSSHLLGMERGMKLKINPEIFREDEKVLKKYVSEGCFFILQEDRTVFSYLKDNTFKVVTEQNPYHFYYYHNGFEAHLPDEAAIKNKLKYGKVIMCTAEAGDTIFVDRGIPIYQIAASNIHPDN